METILTLILENGYLTFGLVFGLTVSILRLAFWCYGRVIEIRTQHSSFAKDLEKNTKNIDEIRTDIVYIKANLSVLAEAINKEKQHLVQSHSPLSLTEEGKAVAKELDAERLIASNWESKILPLMRTELKSKNPYDIQQYCLEKFTVLPEKFLSTESLEHIKFFAYNKGKSIFQYLQVMGIIIRDRYMQENNIPIDDIDKSAPRS